MTRRSKQIMLVLMVLALAALLLLATSLSDLRLQAGSPFPGASGDAATRAIAGETPGSYRSAIFVEAILGVILLLFLIYLPTRLARLVSVRNILWLAGGFVLLLGLLSVLPRVAPGAAMLQAEESNTVPTPSSFARPVSPLGEPPPALLLLAAGGLLLGTGLLVVLLLRQTSRPSAAAAALGQEAEKALQQLEAGAAFRDVIIRCYLQMTELLRREQRLERRESMTAREFQDWLGAKGIPAAPVRQLTSLFETVRYGNDGLDPQGEKAGLECLEQIRQYCRAGSGAK